MAVSKIHICNLALACLGEDAIRAFDESNKRSRMCDVFFDSLRDYLLTKFDWPFAKRFIQLQPLDGVTMPAGKYAYQLPSDCRNVRDLDPPGSKDYWEVFDQQLVCKKTPEETVFIYYTAKVEDVAKFTDTFATMLYLLMAVRMGPVITQDKKLVESLLNQYRMEQAEAWESEANEGNDYRSHDEDPNNDPFVYPDGYLPIDEIYGGS